MSLNEIWRDRAVKAETEIAPFKLRAETAETRLAAAELVLECIVDEHEARKGEDNDTVRVVGVFRRMLEEALGGD